MDTAEFAFAEKVHGNKSRSEELFCEAFELEKAAAELLKRPN